MICCPPNWKLLQTVCVLTATSANTLWCIVKTTSTSLDQEKVRAADLVLSILITILFFIGLQLRDGLLTASNMFPEDMREQLIHMLDLQTQIDRRTAELVRQQCDNVSAANEPIDDETASQKSHETVQIDGQDYHVRASKVNKNNLVK